VVLKLVEKSTEKKGGNDAAGMKKRGVRGGEKDSEEEGIENTSVYHLDNLIQLL